jgi:hypothetical protein
VDPYWIDTERSSSSKVAEPTRQVVRLLQSAMDLFDRHVTRPATHGNERLHLRGMVGLLLAGAFEPAVQSLRTLDDLSLHPKVKRISGVDRVARSTLSDAMARFDPQTLAPLIKAIRGKLPPMERFDPQTVDLARRIIAADGSWFNLAGEVAHALQCTRGTQDRQCRVRLNLQLDVDGFSPVDFDVSGKDNGSEAAAFIARLHGDCIYVVDRNFVHFRFINAVLEKNSNLVLRLRKNTLFEATQARDLTERDIEHRVLRDQIGVLPGPCSPGNADARSCTDRPPSRTLRRVTIWDPKNKCEVILLTDLLDVPAYIVGVLYRLRWQIELFFRWLKVLAGFEHLVSQSPRGITMQFYVAVLMTLLIHLQTGLRPSKYGLLWVSWLASDRATPDMMAQAMARHEKERLNAARRRAVKKQAN